jgi:hypothetical protein
MALGLWRRGGPWPLAGGRVSVLCLDFFLVFFVKMVKRRLHLEVRIKSSSSYPRSGGASRADGGRVELCARRIQSVFPFVAVVSGQSLPIYGCYHWRWLLL